MSYDPLEGSQKYKVLREIGRGGMGEVFLGEHLSLGTKVVIKLLHAELSGKSNLVDRMRLEAQACARLNHPNIVRVTDFDSTASGRPYFVMEYLPGRSLLEEVAARGGYVAVEDAIDMVRQALDGLAVAHAAGLVHRDIKLDNLFLCESGSQPGLKPLVKILDFGVAKVVDSGTDQTPAPLMVPTGTGVVVGTPRFFAPEQARGMKLDHRADVYAMGLVLYSLVAGRGPFDDAKTITEMAKAHVLNKPQPPSHYAQQAIPPGLDAAVLHAIAKQPKERFQSAAEFAAELERISHEQSASAASSTPSQRQPELPDQTGSSAATAKLPQHPGHPTGPLPSFPRPPDNQAQGAQAQASSAAHPPQQPAAALPSYQHQQHQQPAQALPSAVPSQPQPPAVPAPGAAPQPMTPAGRRFSHGFAAIIMVVACLMGVVLALVIQRL